MSNQTDAFYIDEQGQVRFTSDEAAPYTVEHIDDLDYYSADIVLYIDSCE